MSPKWKQIALHSPSSRRAKGRLPAGSRAHTSPENISSAAGRARPGRPGTISGLAPAWKAHAGLSQIFPPRPLTFLQLSPRPPLLTHSLLSFLPQNKGPANVSAAPGTWPPGPGLRRLGFGEGPWGGLLTESRGGCGLRRGHGRYSSIRTSPGATSLTLPGRETSHPGHRVTHCIECALVGGGASAGIRRRECPQGASHPHTQPEVQAQPQHPQVSPGDTAPSPGPAPRGGASERVS